MQLPGLAQVAIRHLGSYAELLGQAAGEYQASCVRRAMLAAGALLMATATLVAAWATGLGLLWDTPWRLTYCISSVVLFVVITTVLGLLANRPAKTGPYGKTLREEATQDLALLNEWRSSP